MTKSISTTLIWLLLVVPAAHANLINNGDFSLGNTGFSSDYRYTTGIQVLMSNYNMEKLTLSIVDGFAGGGEYSSEDGAQFHEGSPLIALTTIAAKEAELNVGRSKPRKVDAKYYFVEKIKSNFNYLDQLLRARFPASRFGSNIELLNGTFQDKGCGRAALPLAAAVFELRGHSGCKPELARGNTRTRRDGRDDLTLAPLVNQRCAGRGSPKGATITLHSLSTR